MRITNGMIMNNTLRNVNRSKTNMSDAENQTATEKKITRPSDDPIIAIRALTLRSSLSEINMYLKNNIPEAESWMKVTEGALDNVDGVLSDVYKYCTQGASDEFTEKDRSSIIEVMTKFKDAVYAEMNTDYAGRFCFTGYRTDSSFTFLDGTEAANKKYSITQEFSGDDLLTMNVMRNEVDIDNIQNIAAADTPDSVSVNRLRLAYSGCEATGASTVDIDGTTYTPQAISYNDFKTLVEDGTFDGASQQMYYIYDTGELAMTDDMYETVKNADKISFTYDKTGFAKGDVKPEMYFDCVDNTDAANPVDYHRTEGGQIISYAINFGQTLQVNTLGINVVNHDIGRDIDDMCNALKNVEDVEYKLKKLKEMKDSDAYAINTDEISSMIAATQKELDYALDNMKKLFSKEMGRVKDYQQTVDLQMADLGARNRRLSLTKARLTEQYTTFDELKSSNEDVELEDALIKASEAETLYQASLKAASSCVQQSLLEYI